MAKSVMQNRNTEFIKNTVILLIGKFSTQFMSLLLLPLFTHYLLAEEFGVVDLLQSYITLFVPILTLRIDSAVFRFLIDVRKDEQEKVIIITNISFILLVGIVCTMLLSVILGFFIDISYYSFVVINVIILMISNVLLQVLRGLGKTLYYSVASIITGLSTLLVNVILILLLDYGAESILVSSSIANIICIVFIIVIVKYFKYIKMKRINANVILEILRYSLPMIPNSLSWWIVNVSDRTLISAVLGTAFNGIYTISCKFSNILNSVFSIFIMSWQETATIHINDEDRDLFFSNIINKILILFSSIALIILGLLPLCYDLLIGEGFLQSYQYIPILLYANTWNVLNGLIGGIYVAKKKTKEIANTTIISAILNILINLLLIKYIGLYAACISTLLAYFIMSVYRCWDCKKYVNIQLKKYEILAYTLIFILCSYIYLLNDQMINYFNLLIILGYCFIANKEIVKTVVTKTKRLIL